MRRCGSSSSSSIDPPHLMQAEQLAKMDQLIESGGVAEETDDVVFFSNWNTAIVIQVIEWNRGVESFTSRLSRKVHIAVWRLAASHTVCAAHRWAHQVLGALPERVRRPHAGRPSQPPAGAHFHRFRCESVVCPVLARSRPTAASPRPAALALSYLQ